MKCIVYGKTNADLPSDLEYLDVASISKHLSPKPWFVTENRQGHGEPHALLFANSVWIRLCPTDLWTLKGWEMGPTVD